MHGKEFLKLNFMPKNPRPLIVEYWTAEDRQIYCHLKSPNGNILLVSEGYKRYLSVTKVYYALKRTGALIVLRKRKD